MIFTLAFTQWVSNEKIINEMVSGVEAKKASFLHTVNIDVKSITITGIAQKQLLSLKSGKAELYDYKL